MGFFKDSWNWLTRSPVPIVPPELEERVLFHKYQSCYGSIVYNLVISPVCDFTVNHIIPPWIAPNLITFTAFCINLIPHIWCAYQYGLGFGGYDEPCSRELCFAYGLCFGIYMWLDNCDGKQARKTGNGSPLGMIVDHQADIIVAVLNSFGIQRMMNVGNRPDCICILFISVFPFYYVMLEQYYTGIMDFPVINGVDEGTFMYVWLCWAGAWYGSKELWWENQYDFFRNGTTIPFFECVKVVLQTAMTIMGIVGVFNIWRRRHTEYCQKMYEFRFAIGQFFFYPISLFTYHAACIFSPTEIWKTHNRAMQLGHGLQFIYICLIINYQIVLFEKVNAWRRTILITWILYWINILSFLTKGVAVFDEVTLIYATNTMQAIVICFQIYNVQSELLKILNLELFRVKGPEWQNPRFNPKWKAHCIQHGIELPNTHGMTTRSKSQLRKVVEDDLKDKVTAEQKKHQ